MKGHDLIMMMFENEPIEIFEKLLNEDNINWLPSIFSSLYIVKAL